MNPKKVIMKEKYFYIRVSTVEQNVARQTSVFEKEEGVKIIDKISGDVPFFERPSAKRILKAVEQKTISELVVYDIDRLGRDLVDFVTTVDFFSKNNICVTVRKMNLSSLRDGKKDPSFEIIANVLAIFAQSELARIRERQAEGIAEAKKRGAYKGKPKGAKNKDFKSKVEKYPNVKACLESGMSIDKTVSATGVSRSTVKRIRKEYFEI